MGPGDRGRTRSQIGKPTGKPGRPARCLRSPCVGGSNECGDVFYEKETSNYRNYIFGSLSYVFPPPIAISLTMLIVVVASPRSIAMKDRLRGDR